MSNPNRDYSTLSEAVEDLQSLGYTYEFDVDGASLYSSDLPQKFTAEKLRITAVYRFEGMSDPDDSVALYAIESNEGHKGIVLDSYGVYADEHKTAFLKNIPVVES